MTINNSEIRVLLTASGGIHTLSVIDCLRNNYENTNPDSVLNGDIDEFLENSLFRSKEKNK